MAIVDTEHSLGRNTAKTIDDAISIFHCSPAAGVLKEQVRAMEGAFSGEEMRARTISSAIETEPHEV
jgi:hypothetical protein